MPRSRFFYIFLGGIIFIIAFALTLVLGSILSKTKSVKPTLPAVISQPQVQAPPAIEEKTASAVVEIPEAPAVVEEQMPAPVEVPAGEKEKISKFEFQKGMLYVAWSEGGYSNVNSVKSMEQLAPLGVEWVGLVITQYQDQYNSTKIYPVKGKTPSDESLIFAIRELHELKFKIMLKPHLDLVDMQGKWRGDIGFDNPSDWQAWFDNYATFILHYADIAAKENLEMFCIGTELTSATIGHPERWRDLIKKIRAVYPGQLTYAANWNNEFEQITFWDALDYGALDPYFPLVCSSRPKVEELKSAWQDWIKMIEAWQKKINKPVIFTEISYKSSRDAADEPWQHIAIGELDLELQVNLYKALLESFWDKPWFYGVYWWYWGTNPRMGGLFNRGFTPQNKPSQEVIKEWYSKPISAKSY